uniref:Uncharacterized protein n=1 Tax=Glossina brevipalpis TaxID=37001 RepID=A0A1A9X055_9MUSC
MTSSATAVEVRNGYKYYGSKSNPKIVLNYLNMSVLRGSIYGLLGASGCGKTTLLSCLVGQRQLNTGDVRVFGIKPGMPGSGVPGIRVGYMPQEIALVEEMSVKETIYYFGRIYGMTDEKIYEKFKSLCSLLQLPPTGHLIKKCSGGQQRRVSFACAMIHDPELLILDEPTVGLDPELREKIWEFLIETTRNNKLAVIITTHYIEEARQANCIGLMRNGVLLAEDTPENIMRRFEVNSVEEAFLILSQRQGDSDVIDTAQLPRSDYQTASAICDSVEVIDSTIVKENSIKDQLEIEDSNKKLKNKALGEWLSITRGRIKALMIKNFVQLSRQPSGIIFMLLFPLLDLTCFYLAIGRTPQDLKVGLVTEEFSKWDTCYDPHLRMVSTFNETCYLSNTSCLYVKELEATNHINRVFYDNLEDAYRDAKEADILGYVYVPHNFSQSMQNLIENGRYTDDEDIANAEIAVRLDMTDRQVSLFLEQKLREAFGNYLKTIIHECKLPASVGNLPINFQKPIYGSEDIEFQQFVAPGVIMTMVFFLATLMTASVFISERLDGIWDRSLVAGVSTTQMLWAHLFTQLIVMVIQSTEVIVFVGLVFDTYNKGSTVLLIFLLSLNSFCGMLFGLLISVWCKSHIEANFSATGAFYPMIILCGLLWPLEGMPTYLRKIVVFFPFTLSTTSARNIIEKGWDLTHPDVYNGFLVIVAWIIIFFSFCMIGTKRNT